MAVTVPVISSAIPALHSHVYVGDAFTLGGMAALGQLDGDIEVTATQEVIDLLLQQTGPTPHTKLITGETIQVTVPVVIASAAVWLKIRPNALFSAGRSAPYTPVTTTVLIAPDTEVGAGLTYNGTVWAPTAPVYSLWIWKAVITTPSWAYSRSTLKQVVPITASGMFYSANPEDHKLWTGGDPVAKGVTLLRL